MKYPIVLFEPDDLHLVGSSSVSRRNYFDRVFGQLSEKYSEALLRYNKALRQRNELFEGRGVRQEDLFFLGCAFDAAWGGARGGAQEIRR